MKRHNPRPRERLQARLAQLNVFIEAVSEYEEMCRYGHFGCSNRHGGMCLDEEIQIYERERDEYLAQHGDPLNVDHD